MNTAQKRIFEGKKRSLETLQVQVIPAKGSTNSVREGSRGKGKILKNHRSPRVHCAIGIKDLGIELVPWGVSH